MISLVTVKTTKSSDVIVTLDFSPEGESDQHQYRGSGAVWHKYPSGENVPNWLEEILTAKWRAWKWEQEDRA